MSSITPEQPTNVDIPVKESNTAKIAKDSLSFLISFMFIQIAGEAGAEILYSKVISPNLYTPEMFSVAHDAILIQLHIAGLAGLGYVAIDRLSLFLQKLKSAKKK